MSRITFRSSELSDRYNTPCNSDCQDGKQGFQIFLKNTQQLPGYLGVHFRVFLSNHTSGSISDSLFDKTFRVNRVLNTQRVMLIVFLARRQRSQNRRQRKSATFAWHRTAALQNILDSRKDKRGNFFFF